MYFLVMALYSIRIKQLCFVDHCETFGVGPVGRPNGRDCGMLPLFLFDSLHFLFLFFSLTFCLLTRSVLSLKDLVALER